MERSYGPIVRVSTNGIEELERSLCSSESIGEKAHGLLQLPPEWVPSFFCVAADCDPFGDVLLEAARRCGMQPNDPVLVRSSGTEEGLEQRGTLVSESCDLSEASEVIQQLRKHPSVLALPADQQVHLIVQRRIKAVAKGHLSNERRITRFARDWVATVEPSAGHPEEKRRVAVRQWRRGGSPSTALDCTLRANMFRVLEEPGRWAGGRRLHMEWVWDGGRIWIVQCEPARVSGGVNPRALVQKPLSLDPERVLAMRCFRVANACDFESLKKLNNARLYESLGYEMPNFYVLDRPDLLAEIQLTGEVPADLIADLQELCRAPFILRTDGRAVPDAKRHMLPRSDELRSEEAARCWLIGDFREKLGELHAGECQVVLVGHHFVPAVSSAWALAEPGSRRVRIEALWGIPEGIYYFPHDVFDVDVARVGFQRADFGGVRKPRPRVRYKDKFIAPDPLGAWVVHEVAAPADYAPSISSDAWIREVANATRAIAERLGFPVVVMWFIGLADAAEDRAVLPWYHDRWDVSLPDSHLGKSGRLGSGYTITTMDDFERLVAEPAAHAAVRRVRIDPTDGAIVRDPGFIERLAGLVLERQYIVELKGGVLSHVYYTLRRTGCEVRCDDAFGTREETLEFNKVVRDGIPDVIRENGEDVEVAVVRGEGLLKGLRHKLVEEALEVLDALDTESIVEELADVLEVIRAIERTLGIPVGEVEESRRRKARKRGTFARGTVLLETRLPPPMWTPLFDGGPGWHSDSDQVRAGEREISDIPESIRAVNVDRRVQDGVAERLITLTFPVQNVSVSAARQVFDLPTLNGRAHPMRFDAEVSRKGGELRVRFTLANVPAQMELFDGDNSPAS